MSYDSTRSLCRDSALWDRRFSGRTAINSTIEIFMQMCRLLVASLLFAAIPSIYAAGTLDPTFANGEKSALVNVRYPSVAVSPDGRIAVAGTLWSGSFGQFQSGRAAMFDNAG